MRTEGTTVGWGLAAGAGATVAMTAAMKALKAAHFLGEAPPRKITRRLFSRGGKRLSGDDATWMATMAHFGFGAACGGLFTVLGGARKRSRSAAVLRGALYGSAIWLIAYGEFLPRLGLIPTPKRDRPGRPSSMMVAHLIYGAALGLLSPRGRRPRLNRRVGVPVA